MHETEFYQQILGLMSPWIVANVNLDLEAGQVDVHVEHADGAKFRCPECDRQLACDDHVSERRWRHLDTMQYRTVLHAKPPCVKCPEHWCEASPAPVGREEQSVHIVLRAFLHRRLVGDASRSRCHWNPADELG